MPAGGVAVFEPGGNHIMLMGIDQDLVRGQTVDLTLQLADGSTLAVHATVQDQPKPPITPTETSPAAALPAGEQGGG